jgi:predicted MFS family arabinose efflux permease
VISYLGSAMSSVALPFAVLAIGGSPADIGYVATAALLATMVSLLVGGAVADRLPRHRVMVAADVLMGVSQAAGAALLLAGQARVWELAVLAAAGGVGFGFFMPAATGLLPQTVPEAELSQANAMTRVGSSVARISGAAAGGLVVGLAGPGWGLAADAASFAVAAALRAGMRFPALPPAEPSHLLSELRTGWREFIARRWLWAIVLQFAFLCAVTFGALSVLGPLVADARLGGATGWGTVMSAFAAGSVAGGVLMIRLRFSRMLLAGNLSMPVFAIWLFALAAPVPLAVVAAAAFVAGVSSEVFAVNWITAMQQEIPPNLLSRLSAYDFLGSQALAPAGTVLAGPLAVVFGLTPVLAVGGAVVVFLAVPVMFIPEVRQLRRRPAEAAPAGTALAETALAETGEGAGQPGQGAVASEQLD